MTKLFEDPVQQEIWATVRAMNDTWTKGNAADLSQFFHRDMIALAPTVRHRMEGVAACVAGWEDFVNVARVERWAEVAPVVRVYGDAAVVAYDFDMSFVIDAERIKLGGRDMFFFVREEGRWWAVADQFSPHPS